MRNPTTTPVTGNKQFLSYISIGRKVNTESSLQKVLSIRLCADGFSFSVHGEGKDGPEFSYTSCPVEPDISLTANLRRTFAAQEALYLPYRRTDVLLDTSCYTPVPLELFEDEQIEDIYYCNHTRKMGEVVLYDILQRSNVVIVFAMDKSAYTLLTEQFPNVYVHAAVSPLVGHWAAKSRMGSNRKCYICLRKRTMDMLVFEYGKPLLVGSYSCKNSSDIAYYCLNAWKQLGSDQERDELYLVGEGADGAELQALLRTFVKSVSVISPSAEFNRSMAARNPQVPYDMLALLETAVW